MAKEKTDFDYRNVIYRAGTKRSREFFNYQLRIGIDTKWLACGNNSDIVFDILEQLLKNHPLINYYKVTGLAKYRRTEELEKPLNKNWLYGTRDERGCDRDQMGKEVCIYLFNDCDVSQLPQLKHLLCTLWQRLQEKNVPLRSSVAPGDKPILLNNIPTPFAYTFERNNEWETRHGILWKDITIHPDDQYPNHVLNTIEFSAQDLSQHGIVFNPQKDFEALIKLHKKSISIFQEEVNKLIDSDEIDFNIDILFQRLASLNKEIKDVYQIGSTEEPLYETDEVVKNIYAKFPGKMEHTIIRRSSMMDGKNESELRKAVNQELLDIKKDYTSLQHQLHPSLESVFNKVTENLDKLIKKNPYKMQTLYCRLVLLNKQALALEKYELAISPPNGTLAAIQSYLKNRNKSTMNIFSFWFDYDRGKNRANLFRGLLQKYAHDKPISDLLIYCLLASNDGSNLKQEVIRTLGYSDRSTALQTYKSELKTLFDNPQLLQQLNKEIIAPIIWATNTNGSLQQIEVVISKFSELASMKNFCIPGS
ncbi:hypothetical protein DGG96_18940 [Legionella qingyii]|uniref:Uncharacterized protein n=1 Tax=Legionella qingyii TaxID=2184757 RepID=A0A317TZR2_9GAMM|nr:hypothetical protein [Legionella qingyii]PWY54017.1 hypothetical protein DGG96_19130 [Legionella qingyii]PWY54077.1 hypothetical protein DGG96_18940 [Legionella qingyii]RUR19887.1 hypothetical protein ELY20_15315 [Legionella qingyii]